MSIMILGEPHEVEAFLRSPDGRATAQAAARSIFEDEDRLAAIEAGLEDVTSQAVEEELARLLAARDRKDPA